MPLAYVRSAAAFFASLAFGLLLFSSFPLSALASEPPTLSIMLFEHNPRSLVLEKDKPPPHLSVKLQCSDYRDAAGTLVPGPVEVEIRRLSVDYSLKQAYSVDVDGNPLACDSGEREFDLGEVLEPGTYILVATLKKGGDNLPIPFDRCVRCYSRTAFSVVRLPHVEVPEVHPLLAFGVLFGVLFFFRKK